MDTFFLVECNVRQFLTTRSKRHTMKKLLLLSIFVISLGVLHAEFTLKTVSTYMEKMPMGIPLEQCAHIMQEAFEQCDFTKSTERANLRIVIGSIPFVCNPVWGQPEVTWEYALNSGKLQQACWEAYEKIVTQGKLSISKEEAQSIQSGKSNAIQLQTNNQMLINNQRMLNQMNQMW